LSNTYHGGLENIADKIGSVHDALADRESGSYSGSVAEAIAYSGLRISQALQRLADVLERKP
jgi:predicted trehalose synthase